MSLKLLNTMFSIPLIILFLVIPSALGMIGINLLFPEVKEKKINNKHH